MQIVLIPGLMNDGWVWHRQIGALSRIGTVQIARNDGCDSLATMADRILDSARAPLWLVGHSMGGRVALEAWARAPERIGGLALLDTGAHGRRAKEVPGRTALVALARREGLRAVAAQWLPPMLSERARGDSALVAEIVAMLERATPDIFAGQQHALLNREDRTPLLPTIACPCLVATGSEDGWASPEQHARIADAIPDAELHVIADAGHMLPVEAPDAVTTMLVDWLTRKGARALPS
jgi:pimeloyl-ACP methyl ester carboxylesterase